MSNYQSKPLDERGKIAWDENEDQIWSDLVARQQKLVKQKACKAYLDGLDLLKLPTNRAPQIDEINQVLLSTTGWCVQPVPALIDFDHFFKLLANKQFPVATFLRNRDEFDYLQEPDFFHEVYGHCAMLTNSDFAEFTEAYGKLGLQANSKERVYLARLYWFTVEFGLVKESGALKVYGGGILSSPGESLYALDSDVPERQSLDLQTVLRTPYRIDIMQPIYFVLEDISELFALSKLDLMKHVHQAMKLGLLPAKFEQKTKNNQEEIQC